MGRTRRQSGGTWAVAQWLALERNDPELLRSEVIARVKDDLFDISADVAAKGEAFLQSLVQKMMLSGTGHRAPCPQVCPLPVAHLFGPGTPMRFRARRRPVGG